VSESGWKSWIPTPSEGRDVGVRKPHISFARFHDGSLMVEVRHWPNWPHDSDGYSESAGYDLADAWDSYLLQFEEFEDDEDDGEVAA